MPKRRKDREAESCDRPGKGTWGDVEKERQAELDPNSLTLEQLEFEDPYEDEVPDELNDSDYEVVMEGDDEDEGTQDDEEERWSYTASIYFTGHPYQCLHVSCRGSPCVSSGA